MSVESMRQKGLRQRIMIMMRQRQRQRPDQNERDAASVAVAEALSLSLLLLLLHVAAVLQQLLKPPPLSSWQMSAMFLPHCH